MPIFNNHSSLLFLHGYSSVVWIAFQAGSPDSPFGNSNSNYSARKGQKETKFVFNFQRKDHHLKLVKPLITRGDRDPSADSTNLPGKMQSCNRGYTRLKQRLRSTHLCGRTDAPAVHGGGEMKHFRLQKLEPGVSSLRLCRKAQIGVV